MASKFHILIFLTLLTNGVFGGLLGILKGEADEDDEGLGGLSAAVAKLTDRATDKVGQASTNVASSVVADPNAQAANLAAVPEQVASNAAMGVAQKAAAQNPAAKAQQAANQVALNPAAKQAQQAAAAAPANVGR